MNKKPNKLTPREALVHLQEGALLVDIRPEYEINYRGLDVPNSIYLHFNNYKDLFESIPKNILLIVLDSVGINSSKVAQVLMDNGYNDVAYITGGIIAWEQFSLPIKKDFHYELNGGCACMLKSEK